MLFHKFTTFLKFTNVDNLTFLLFGLFSTYCSTVSRILVRSQLQSSHWQTGWNPSHLVPSYVSFLLPRPFWTTYLSHSPWQVWNQHTNNIRCVQHIPTLDLINVFVLDQEVLKFSISIRVTSFYVSPFFDLTSIW